MGTLKHEPGMNIVNQINAGLNDVRSALVELSEPGIDVKRQWVLRSKIRFITDQVIIMVDAHVSGQSSIPWSERKGIVEEEFS